VEKLLLGPLVIGEKLDVVDGEDVGVAVAVAELVQQALLDGLDEVIDERLTGEEGDLAVRIVVSDLPARGVEEVGLAEADAAVQEDGVVGASRRFADGLAGGIGEPVGRGRDERIEGVVFRKAAWRRRPW